MYSKNVDKNGNDDIYNRQDRQRAYCSIKAGDIEASAEAYINQSLKEICSLSELNNLFKLLENKMMKEFRELHTIINDMHKNYEILEKKCSSFKENLQAEKAKSEVSNLLKNIGHLELKTNKTFIKNIKNYNEKENNELNDTVLVKKETKSFRYYWKIHNFPEKLRSNITVEASPIFTVAGRHMKIKAFLNHLNRDFFFVQLDQNADDNQQNNGSIVLETDEFFKEITNKVLKYQLAVLAQGGAGNDLISRQFFSESDGFLLPNNALMSSLYLVNETILLQVTIYL